MPRRWGARSGGRNRTPCIRSSSRTSTGSAFRGRSRSPRAWRAAAASSGAAGANATARSLRTASTASQWCCPVGDGNAKEEGTGQGGEEEEEGGGEEEEKIQKRSRPSRVHWYPRGHGHGPHGGAFLPTAGVSRHRSSDPESSYDNLLIERLVVHPEYAGFE